MKRTLTPEQEQSILEEWSHPGHRSQREIGEAYSVSQATISRLIKEKFTTPSHIPIQAKLQHAHNNITSKLEHISVQDESPIITKKFKERESRALRAAMNAIGPNPIIEEDLEEPEEEMERWDAVVFQYKDHFLIKGEDRPLMQRAICIAAKMVGLDLFGDWEAAEAEACINAIYEDLLIDDEEANHPNLEQDSE